MTESKRGPSRNEESRQAILQATAAQFIERGWPHLTIEGIAQAAGVGKQTIYRWWHSKSALIADCLFEGLLLPNAFVIGSTGDLRHDVKQWLDDTFVIAQDPQSADFFRSLLNVAAEDKIVGRHLFDAVSGGESTLTARLNLAIADGELPVGAPVNEIAEILVGAVVMYFIFRAPIDEGLSGRLVDAILGQ